MWVSGKKWLELWQEIRSHGRSIATINEEMGMVQEQTKHIPVMRNNIKWIKWLICGIFLAIIVGLLQGFGILNI